MKTMSLQEPAKQIKEVKVIARFFLWGSLLALILFSRYMSETVKMLVCFTAGFGYGGLAIISTYRERFVGAVNDERSDAKRSLP